MISGDNKKAAHRRRTPKYRDIKKLEEYLKTSTSDSPTAVFNAYTKTLDEMPDVNEAVSLYEMIVRQLQNGRHVNAMTACS